MEGKLFYGDAALPTAAENTDFSFDLQRFAVTDANWKANVTVLPDGGTLTQNEIDGYDTQGSDTLIKLEYTNTSSQKVTKYFKYMQSALNAVLGNQVSGENNTYAADGGSNYSDDATITLLGNITAGDGFVIGCTRDTKDASSTKSKATKVTIDLAGYDYTFAYELNNANSGANKSKGITTGSATGSSAIIKGGLKSDGSYSTISISSSASTKFERLMRSYIDVTLENVVIDGRNLSASKQTKDLDGAVVCHSKGTLNITGATSILANDGYYALSDKAGDQHTAGATVNINTTGTISNFGLFEWSGNGGTEEEFTTALNATNISIGGGNIGDVVLSPAAVSLGAATRMTVSGGTFNSVDMSGQNFLYYADDKESLINTRATTDSATAHLQTGFLNNIGVAGWNPSDTKGKFSFIGASIGAAENSHAGSRILTVTDTGETNTSAFGWDATNYALGIPTVGTVTWNDGDDTTKSAYSIARTKYDRNQEAVTLTAVELGDSLGYAKIVEKTGVTAPSGLLASTVKKIDASAVTVAASIVGNALDNTIYAGTGANSLVGGSGKDVFVYTKGADVITDYVVGADKVTLTDTDFAPSGESVKAVDNDLQIAFGAGNSLTFSGQGTLVADSVLPTRGIEIESKGKSYIYTAYSVADMSTVKGNMLSGVTLASGFNGSSFTSDNPFVTISGAAVDKSLNITGTAGANYIAAGKVGGSLNGNGGDDTLVGGAGGDVFVYEKGKAVIDGYDKAKDKLALSINESLITSAKVNTKDQLVFSADNKANSITFNAVDSGAVEAVSLESGGVFTKDGKFNDNKLTLFKDTRGRVETTDSIYSGITGIDASAVTGNVITMTGASVDGGATYKFAANKKADVFEYNGGSVTLSGYVADSDKIDLGAYSFTSFTANSSGVSLATSISGGSSTGQIVLEGNYTTGEVLLHDDERNKRNQYSKFVFATDNVLQDKATRPTSATVFGGATLYDARTTGGNTVKNIVLDSRTTGASIQAGNVNTNIDASNAGTTGVSLVSGTHNDKFTGSKGNDLFVYTAGKDVINGYASGDSISLKGFGVGDITKVSKSGKSITFKFASNKNSLAVKSDSAIDKININGADYTFAKKGAIISSGESGSVASLTSGFSGTYTADSSATSIIGSAVTKNLTIKGQKNADDYIIAGEGKKTKLQGQGGNDTLVGGSGKGEDTFFYKKGETGNISVQNFGAGEDKIKISGSKVVSSLSTDTTKALSITMSNGAVITVDSFKPASGDAAETKNIGDILIKANNTGYWFDPSYKIEGTTTTGAWVTSVDKISNSAMKNSAFTVVDLGYGTNLVKAGLAYKTDTSFSSVSPSTASSSTEGQS